MYLVYNPEPDDSMWSHEKWPLIDLVRYFLSSNACIYTYLKYYILHFRYLY